MLVEGAPVNFCLGPQEILDLPLTISEVEADYVLLHGVRFPVI